MSAGPTAAATDTSLPVTAAPAAVGLPVPKDGSVARASVTLRPVPKDGSAARASVPLRWVPVPVSVITHRWVPGPW